MVIHNTLFFIGMFFALIACLGTVCACYLSLRRINHGRYYTVSEALAIFPDFDEEYYINQNPDVAGVIGKGKYYSAGVQHYAQFGYYERRPARSKRLDMKLGA